MIKEIFVKSEKKDSSFLQKIINRINSYDLNFDNYNMNTWIMIMKYNKKADLKNIKEKIKFSEIDEKIEKYKKINYDVKEENIQKYLKYNNRETEPALSLYLKKLGKNGNCLSLEEFFVLDYSLNKFITEEKSNLYSKLEYIERDGNFDVIKCFDLEDLFNVNHVSVEGGGFHDYCRKNQVIYHSHGLPSNEVKNEEPVITILGRDILNDQEKMKGVSEEYIDKYVVPLDLTFFRDSIEVNKERLIDVAIKTLDAVRLCEDKWLELFKEKGL